MVKSAEEIWKTVSKASKLSNQKILEAFRSSSSAAMKLKSAILSFKIRLDKTSELYALRVISLSENHSIKQRTSYIFAYELETDIDVDENHYLDWNQYSQVNIKKQHSTQLIKVLHSICKYLSKLNLESLTQNELISAPWTVFSKLNIHISKLNKKLATVKHLNRLKSLMLVNNKLKNAILYTDESKLDTNLEARLCYIYKNITHQQFWNLEIYMKVYDTKLFDIHQTLKLELKEIAKYQRI